LREQDFGNFQPGTEETERLWRERAEYGHFLYRIPNGESGADVYDRVSSFNGSLWRRFSEEEMASVAILVTHGLCSRVFLMAWYHYSVEFFEDLRNINHCEFLVMKLGANGRYVLQNNLRRWSDLRRERAARKSVSSPATEPIPSIPVRRWATHRSANDPSGSTLPFQPRRKNTADMFRDEHELKEEPEDEDISPAQTRTKSQQDQGGSSSQTQLFGQSQTSSTMLSVDTPNKNSGKSRTKKYLGRDGGGTKSGAGSPMGSESSDESEIVDTSTQTETVAASVDSSNSKFAGSLAKALRGDFDDPNRVLADALGDQSDAEVEEADLEVGTKEREDREMEQILEDERRDRSQSVVGP
jgi:hypothetical protein